MCQRVLKRSIAVFVVATYVTLIAVPGYAADPTVKVIVNPNKTDVSVGSEPVALTAKATGKGLQYTWKLQGPGKLEGIGSAVFYNIPTSIEGKSAQAIVTVTVTDEAGQQTTETVTFNILVKETPKPVAPAPVEKKGGGGHGLLLGLGAAALVGGGILALAAGKGGDENKNPFSGTFIGSERSGTSSRGNPYTRFYTFELNQDGNTITGSLIDTATLTDCCTAVYSVPVTGTTSGNSAVLEWGAGEGRCTCSWTTWTPDLEVGSDHAILINDNTLLFDGGADYTRVAKERAENPDSQVDRDTDQGIGGEFFRQ